MIFAEGSAYDRGRPGKFAVREVQRERDSSVREIEFVVSSARWIWTTKEAN